MTAVEFHEAAGIFPLLEGQELAELAADIREHGLREPIVLHPDGRILDGRNRYRACVEFEPQVAPVFEAWDGQGDEIDFVVSLNLRRRHLDNDQRRVVAAKIVTYRAGRPTKYSQSAKVSREQAATLMNVDVAGLDRARALIRHGAPELVSIVERGDVSVSAAADVAELPEAEQREVVARGAEEIAVAARAARRSSRARNSTA